MKDLDVYDASFFYRYSLVAKIKLRYFNLV